MYSTCDQHNRLEKLLKNKKKIQVIIKGRQTNLSKLNSNWLINHFKYFIMPFIYGRLWDGTVFFFISNDLLRQFIYAY